MEGRKKNKVVKRTSINKNILFEIYNNIDWRRLEAVISKKHIVHIVRHCRKRHMVFNIGNIIKWRC